MRVSSKPGAARLPRTAGSLDSRRSVARLLLEVLSKTEALVTVENRKKQAITTRGLLCIPLWMQ